MKIEIIKGKETVASLSNAKKTESRGSKIINDNRPSYITQTKLIKAINNRTTQFKAHFCESRDQYLYDRSLYVAFEGDNFVSVKAHPQFNVNIGNISYKGKTSSKIKAISDFDKHTEPILISSLYEGKGNDWTAADKAVEKANNTAKREKFYLFSERKPCNDCQAHLNSDLYTKKDYVTWAPGIYNTGDIAYDFFNDAKNYVKEKYKVRYPNTIWGKPEFDRAHASIKIPYSEPKSPTPKTK